MENGVGNAYATYHECEPDGTGPGLQFPPSYVNGSAIHDLPFGQAVLAGQLVGWDINGGTHTLIKAVGVSGLFTPAIGVAAESYAAGQLGTVITQGVVDVLISNLSPGDTVYLDETNAGHISPTPATSGGAFLQKVGYAVSPTKVFLFLQDAGAML